MTKLGHLSQYNVTLTVESPVFIGSGENIGKKEYAYVAKENAVYILDLERVVSFFEKKGLMQKYQDFLLDEKSRNIANFFDKNRIHSQEYKEIAKYKIDGAGEAIQKNHLREIQLMIKDGQGTPYIPGSSLKGAFRTALLVEMLEGNKTLDRVKLYQEWKEEIQGGVRAIRRMAGNTRKIEAQYLHSLRLENTKIGDAVNSSLRGVSVSDSTPIPLQQLMLVQKIDSSVVGKEQVLPISRECIRPGTQASFTITIDNTMAQKTGITLERLLGAICLHQRQQQEYFYGRFRGNEQQEVPEDALVFWLGGGVGFANKTIVHPALGSKNTLAFNGELLNDLFPNGNHQKDQEIGVSPHMQKLAKYQGKLYRMGQCRLEVQ